MKISKKGKFIGYLLLAIAAIAFIYYYQHKPKAVGQLASVGKVVLPDAPEASLTGTAAVKMTPPGSKVTGKEGLIDAESLNMGWQAQNAEILANGGLETSEGSLYEQAGWHLKITRQDDGSIAQTQMIKYIQDYHDNKTKTGLFITYMGSGVPNYFRGIHEAVKGLGDAYAPVAFMVYGKSYGEDQIIGPLEVKTNKQLLRGKVLRGVKLDGDIDLALKLCADNNIPVNPNPDLFYSDALNLSYAQTFLTAVTDYNANLKEARHIVVNGKTTGKDTTIQIDLVATWTPGDVNAIVGGNGSVPRGGVTIISTKEYAMIMPAVMITCKKFLYDNHDAIVNFIAATAQAGDQIRSFTDVKMLACKLGASVWNEETADYWFKYYNGVNFNKDTHLGGSMVFNLKDMAYELGLDGTRDTYKDVYNTFGKIQSTYYPKDLPDYIAYEKMFDKSFTRGVMDAHPELLEGKALKVDLSTITSDTTTQEIIGNKPYNILFETNSSTIKPESESTLEILAQQVNSSDGLKISTEGYTDNTGSDNVNIPLSQQRAQAVVDYLINTKHIEADRFLPAKGYGSQNPLTTNSTSDGKTKNRRVQIKLIGSKN